MSDLDPLVAQLVERRKALGLSQRKVSRRLGVANQTISETERGRHVPGLALARRWAEVLGVELVGNVWDEPTARPAVTIDPALKFGRPTIGGGRVSVDVVTELAAADRIDEALTEFDLTRPDVLVACWYAGTYGTAHYKRLWGGWAKQVQGDLWSCRYDVPDPPGSG